MKFWEYSGRTSGLTNEHFLFLRELPSWANNGVRKPEPEPEAVVAPEREEDDDLSETG